MTTLRFKGKEAAAVLAALSAGPQYLILYRGQNGVGNALWWRPNRSGYTDDISEAGRYSKEEADSIAGIRGDDFPVPLADVGKRLKVRQVVSHEDGANHVTLKTYFPAAKAGDA